MASTTTTITIMFHNLNHLNHPPNLHTQHQNPITKLQHRTTRNLPSKQPLHHHHNRHLPPHNTTTSPLSPPPPLIREACTQLQWHTPQPTPSQPQLICPIPSLLQACGRLVFCNFRIVGCSLRLVLSRSCFCLLLESMIPLGRFIWLEGNFYFCSSSFLGHVRCTLSSSAAAAAGAATACKIASFL